MLKYHCSACQGESDQPGVCQTEGCNLNGVPLTETDTSKSSENEQKLQ